VPTKIEVDQTVNAAFVAAWTVSPGVYQTPFTFDNVDLGSATEWTRLIVEGGLGRQYTLGPAGSRQFERNGVILAEIHVQRGEGGTRRASTLAQIIKDTFEAKSDNGVITFTAQEKSYGPYGRWYKVAVRVPFLYHETK
jgi:hypothetical protein